MANTEYITIKNASRKVLQRMRQIGIDKAQRLQEVQKRWDTGEYKNADIVQLQSMEDFVRIFRSSTGDVYHIALSEDHGVLSSEAVESLNDVVVVGIELRRLEGSNSTGQEVLSAIERTMNIEAGYLI